jgi:PQQ-dependent dehydrogenase (methanol/ethanol family)
MPVRHPLILSAVAVLAGLAAASMPLGQPRAAAASAGAMNWRFYGNTLSNDRFQNIDQVNPANVHMLKPAWVFHTGVLDPKASLEVSPIVVNGVMYVTTGHDDVFALNAATGKQLWAYHPESQMPPLDSVQLCCGENNRGVAFGDGKVFIGRLDDMLVALDAATGKPAWQAKVASFANGFSITMAPQFFGGLVIVGTAGGEFDIRGKVEAFNAATGQRVWQFFTTLPGPTWQGNSWQNGGGPVWQTSAVDPKLGLLYVNTGNASPDLNGVRRAGMNLFTDSIVALAVRTGKIEWHFQEVHHDIWDYDAAQPPVLFNLHRGGTVLPALAECGKNNNIYILSRVTGQPIFPVTETPVPSVKPGWQHPWPTQPISSVQPLSPDQTVFPPGGNLPVQPKYTPPRQQKIVITPGSDGGCEWPPGAYSPRTHFFYAGARYEPQIFRAAPNQETGIGSTFTASIPNVHQDFGIFGAINTHTGKIAWTDRVPQPAKSGLMVAGNLVFFGQSNGQFDAADAATGKILWTFDGTSIPHGGGANAAPIAYQAGGNEFIANAFGGNEDDRGIEGSPVGDAIVAFALPTATAP